MKTISVRARETLLLVRRYAIPLALLGAIIAIGVVASPGGFGEIVDDGGLDVDIATTDKNDEYDLNKTERYFIQFLNEERHSRGLQNVTQRSELTEMGESQSRHMAENDYFNHTRPDGTGEL